MRALLLIALLALGAPAFATEEESATPTLKRTDRESYEGSLLKLAEILGALHYLRPLCHPEEGERWRERMNELLRIERPSPQQKNEMVGAFNTGYDTASAQFPQCTPDSQGHARERALEGEALSRRLSERVSTAP